LGGENALKFLDGFLDHADWSEDIIEKVPTGLILEILHRRPEFLSTPLLWRRVNNSDILSKLVDRLEPGAWETRQTLRAMIVAKAWNALAHAIEQLGEPAFQHVFEIIEDSKKRKLDYPDRLYSILWSQPEIVSRMLDHDQVGPISAKLLSAEIDPRSWYIRHVGIFAWQKAAEVIPLFSDQRRSINSAIFLLSVGLSGRGEDAAFLISRSFSAVYEAAETDLAESLWERLEPVLSWYSPSWDRCARLVRSVTRAFKENDWSVALFAETFRSIDHFKRAIEELDKTYSGHKYVVRLKKAGATGEIKWSSAQSSAIRKFA
jgi:hypothetical protein